MKVSNERKEIVLGKRGEISSPYKKIILGIFQELLVIIGILLLLAIKKFLAIREYINRVSKIIQGYNVSATGITVLVYMLFNIMLIIMMTVILIHLIQSYYTKTNLNKNINMIVITLVGILICITSFADLSYITGLERMGVKPGLVDSIRYFLLMRIPVAVMNTSTLLILSVMILCAVRQYSKVTNKGRKFSVIFSILSGITGYIFIFLMMVALEIYLLDEIRGNATEFLATFKALFFKGGENLGIPIIHQIIMAISTIGLTGIFIIIRMMKEEEEVEF